MDPLEIRPGLAIPPYDLSAHFSRSGGPGGQNVNKVETRVELRYAIDRSDALPPPVKNRLKSIAASRLTNDGELVVVSQRFRSQPRNLEDARDRLRELVLAALRPPPKPRRPTKPSRGSKERRLAAKSRHAEKKRLRRGSFGD